MPLKLLRDEFIQRTLSSPTNAVCASEAAGPAAVPVHWMCVSITGGCCIAACLSGVVLQHICQEMRAVLPA
jgi:hypothetical protein